MGDVKKDKFNLEQAFEQMDEILEKMEDKDVSLEDSFALYEKGIKLLRECNMQLDTVEKKMQVLGEGGELDEF